MLIERKQELLSSLDKNYILVRDEDGELLCLLWKDNEWYYVYYMEHYNLTKKEAEALLDKAAWIAMTPVVDEKIREQYKDQLEDMEKKISSQLDENYSNED